MKILHYSLGFPPYRTGGLTKFCTDLMKEQVKSGHEVILLWPGEMQFLGNKTKIRKHKAVENIGSYEVINPLPVPYDEGIKDFSEFMKVGDKSMYEKLLDDLEPDVIHIHTLMGLHKSLLEAAKDKEIRLIFTTHDFFPICPKVTMFRNGQVCESRLSCEFCETCNNTALSIRKIKILQSPIYRCIKDTKIVKKLRKIHRDEYLSDTEDNSISVGEKKDYRKLRQYYYSMLHLMDVIHCNSSIAKEAYEKVFKSLNYIVLPITHADITDHRKKQEFNSKILRIRYLGVQSAAKGYYILKNALDQLWEIRQDFILDVHFMIDDAPEYMCCHDRYGYSDLESIFDNTDILVCPSIWYETFGFTVLEALSFGIPVVVSNCVGSVDILGDGCGIVFNANNIDSLAAIITSISRDDLLRMNIAILSHQKIITISDMTESINSLYVKSRNL